MKKLMLSYGRIMSFAIFLCFISCKKELLLSQEESDRLEMFRNYQNGPKIKEITYSSFLSTVNQARLGNLKQQFNIKTGISKMMSINLPETYQGFAVNTENIKTVERDGHISYIFSIKLSSPHAISFQNLTIDQTKDKTIAFVTTYTPSKKWISNYKSKISQIFEGEIKFTRLNLNAEAINPVNPTISLKNVEKLSSLNVLPKTSLTMICTEYYVYSLSAYPCDSPDNHMPGDGCPWEGEARGPGYRIIASPSQICEEIDFGGAGPVEGGSGGTTPNPDPNYDPCDQGRGSGGASFAKGTRLQLLPPPCDNGGLVTLTNLEFLNESLGLTPPQSRYVQYHPGLAEQMLNYLSDNGSITEDKDYLVWAINYGISNSDMDFKGEAELIPGNINWTDPDNEILYDPDLATYLPYQDHQTWPTVQSVIPYKNFVPNRYIPGTQPPVIENCLVLAKEQLAKKGYTAGGYYLGSPQIFQTYTTQNGVDLNRTKEAVRYLIDKLSNGIPVLAGVDVRAGSSNNDNTTDHFIVIVGMGSDLNGKYFSFYDSSTNWPIYGASSKNKLYYNSADGKISGKTMSQYGDRQGHHDFILTQIRKSIAK